MPEATEVSLSRLKCPFFSLQTCIAHNTPAWMHGMLIEFSFLKNQIISRFCSTKWTSSASWLLWMTIIKCIENIGTSQAVLHEKMFESKKEKRRKEEDEAETKPKRKTC